MNNILFLSSNATTPQASVSGTAMISLALMKSFAAAGWTVGFCGFVKSDKWQAENATIVGAETSVARQLGQVWYAKKTSSEENAREFRKIADKFKPDIVYCFGYESANIANRARGDYKIVATFYDPPYVSSLYKRWTELRYGDIKAKLNVLRRMLDTYRRWRLHFTAELPALRAADVLISHSYKHGLLYQSRLKRPLLYFPNPLEEIPELTRHVNRGSSTFLLAGSLASTVSLTGMYFFAHEVLPNIVDDLRAGRMHIHVVGGGKLSQDLVFMKSVPNIKFLGFVSHDDLLKKYAHATALLIPTPIRLGFRTRIMDCFRYRLPTIVHTANQAGFKELEHRANTLMATTGTAFAAAMRELMADQALGEKISEKAYEQFRTRFSAEIYRDFVIKACKQAPREFLK
jgi:glycosyltransferase involved in cell wall biosynthesis